MCERCMRPLPFFPSSERAHAADRDSGVSVSAEPVLACNECGKPLNRTPGGGFRCLACGYHPSMQDTFIFFQCPLCRTKLAGAGPEFLCPGCGVVCRRN